LNGQAFSKKLLQQKDVAILSDFDKNIGGTRTKKWRFKE
jgi:hypothetical protein